jgi:hypothetical protein
LKRIIPTFLNTQIKDIIKTWFFVSESTNRFHNSWPLSHCKRWKNDGDVKQRRQRLNFHFELRFNCVFSPSQQRNKEPKQNTKSSNIL